MSCRIFRALIFIAAVPGLFCSVQYNCLKGCPAAAGPAVCGEDGLIYHNECLAICQHVTIRGAGACGSQNNKVTNTAAFASVRSSSSSSSEVIPAAAINRYSSEGFRLVGKALTGHFAPQAVHITGTSAAAGGSSSSSFMSIKPVPARTPPALAAGVRKTNDGYVYYLRPSTAAAAFMDIESTFLKAPSQGQTMAGYAPTVSTAAAEVLLQLMTAGRRRLAGGSSSSSKVSSRSLRHLASKIQESNLIMSGVLSVSAESRTGGGSSSSSSGFRRSLRHIIGQDDRVEMTGRSIGWPYTAVGQFVYSNGSCSGVMIGPRAVLTAGHCVYDRQGRIWQRHMKFVPFRHREGPRVVAPYGVIPYDAVTTYAGWLSSENTTESVKFDLAVVRLTDDVIGYKTGWVGLSWDKTGYNGTICLIGYPGDKPQGSQWLSKCNVTDANGEDTRFINSCDVSHGQSGAPMWEWRETKDGGKTPGQFLARAVMSYESCRCCDTDCTCCKTRYNGGCAINALHYNSILKWR